VRSTNFSLTAKAIRIHERSQELTWSLGINRCCSWRDFDGSGQRYVSRAFFAAAIATSWIFVTFPYSSVSSIASSRVAHISFSYDVDGGQRAVLFQKFSLSGKSAGVQEGVVGEGTHFLVPWFQQAIMCVSSALPIG
jgi:hypothetical protein